MTELQIPPPTDLKYHRRSRELTVQFADGMHARLSAEFLRCIRRRPRSRVMRPARASSSPARRP